MARPAHELEPLLKIIAGVTDEIAAEGNPWRVQPMGALDLLPLYEEMITTGAWWDLVDGVQARVRDLLLDHPAELDLAPATPDVRRPQRGDQRGRLLLQLGRGLPDGAQMLAQFTMCGRAGPLHAREQPVQVVE